MRVCVCLFVFVCVGVVCVLLCVFACVGAVCAHLESPRVHHVRVSVRACVRVCVGGGVCVHTLLSVPTRCPCFSFGRVPCLRRCESCCLCLCLRVLGGGIGARFNFQPSSPQCVLCVCVRAGAGGGGGFMYVCLCESGQPSARMTHAACLHVCGIPVFTALLCVYMTCVLCYPGVQGG